MKMAQVMCPLAHFICPLTGAMATRLIAGDADGMQLSGLLWRATGCVDGLYPWEERGHRVRRLGTPALLRGLWSGAQAQVAVSGEGRLRLHEREIGAVHEALVAAWRLLRDGQGLPFPMV